MAEARRKTLLFLNNISPVYDTHDEVVRKKLKAGKFPQTKTGIIKMSSLCFQLGSIVSWVVLDTDCGNLGVSVSKISSISLSFIVQLLLFLLFSFGNTVKNPGAWINWDIGLNFILSFLSIAISVLSMKICKASSLEHLSAIIAIIGAGLGICGCVALFLLYRYVEDLENEATPMPNRIRPDPRKSLFA